MRDIDIQQQAMHENRLLHVTVARCMLRQAKQWRREGVEVRELTKSTVLLSGRISAIVSACTGLLRLSQISTATSERTARS
ncbi:uncharacterized protein LOC116738672 isoform X2 [Nasonia vitripennis]|uniref:Uncharacterized protein n=1 Tax=Nasonia vitripennis TaxID=7425 RepID=A0A7M7R1M5_NASVI|nr:uncharacterized protein LOC116738672 isoform X2 [Nasonia vitripennis]